jgi:large subunit ribosomal protein L22
MSTSARLKKVRVSPRKARLVADQIRGIPVEVAINILTFSPQKTASILKKLLLSAVANAENNQGADIDDLVVSEIYVDQAPVLKRTMPRAKGRADRIIKRSSHFTIKLAEV